MTRLGEGGRQFIRPQNRFEKVVQLAEPLRRQCREGDEGARYAAIVQRSCVCIAIRPGRGTTACGIACVATGVCVRMCVPGGCGILPLSSLISIQRCVRVALDVEYVLQRQAGLVSPVYSRSGVEIPACSARLPLALNPTSRTLGFTRYTGGGTYLIVLST